MKYLFKFLKTGLKSEYDGSKWTVGEWRNENPPTQECVGLNASEYIQDALNYVQGEILAIVECDGKIIKGNDKWTCEKMRIIKRYKWDKEDSVKLAIFCAELSLPIFEKEYPYDNRPRKAIIAAKRYLKNTTQKNKDAAAYNAVHAAHAARAAAYNAVHAAHAARAAAYAAYAASDAAYAAAYDAAHAAYADDTDMKKKIHEYICKMKRIKKEYCGVK